MLTFFESFGNKIEWKRGEALQEVFCLQNSPIFHFPHMDGSVCIHNVLDKTDTVIPVFGINV